MSVRSFTPEMTVVQCSQGGCTAAFLKHHKLRTHVANEHASPGTKSYQCDHEECTKSFSTNQKLRAHIKVHEGKFCALHASHPHLLSCRKALYLRKCYLPRQPGIGLLPNLDCATAPYPRDAPTDVPLRTVCGQDVFGTKGPPRPSEVARAEGNRGARTHEFRGGW